VFHHHQRVLAFERQEQLGRALGLKVGHAEGVSRTNERMLSGRSRTNKLIHFAGDSSLTGSLVHVKINSVQTFLLKGELVLRDQTRYQEV
jgi:tRNA A37 methylthiotransferase MiaB